MMATSSNHALESLKLQHSYHLKKIEKLQDQCNKIEKYHSKRLSKEDNFDHKECQTENVEGNIERASSDFVDGPFQLHDNVFQTLTDTDTLLNLLENRDFSLTATSGIPAKIRQNAKLSCTKKPKDSKTIIEELTIHNDNLRVHVVQLLNEIDQIKMERDGLKQKFHKIMENTLTSNISETHFCQEDFYDLPPLEMPTLGPEFFDEPETEMGELTTSKSGNGET